MEHTLVGGAGVEVNYRLDLDRKVKYRMKIFPRAYETSLDSGKLSVQTARYYT